MSQEKIDVQALMAKIREDIKSEADKLDGSAPSYIPQSQSSSSETPLLYSEELNYLNEHWNNLSHQTEITSHRPVVGPIIVKAKKFLVNSIWNFVLRDYFERERNFQMNLVKHLNNSARYIDDRIEKIFWQLVDKMDQDVKGLNQRVDKLHFLTLGEMTAKEDEVKERLDEIDSIINSIKQSNKLLEEVRTESVSKEFTPLKTLNISSTCPPVFKNSLEEMNQNIETLNKTLSKRN